MTADTARSHYLTGARDTRMPNWESSNLTRFSAPLPHLAQPLPPPNSPPPLLPPPPPPDPQPLWMWPGVQDVPHWGEITCACCVNRSTEIGVALLDPVRCFCVEPLGVPVRPTPLRKKMMLEAETGLVAKRLVQFEEQTVDCIDKMQHLQSGNHAQSNG